MAKKETKKAAPKKAAPTKAAPRKKAAAKKPGEENREQQRKKAQNSKLSKSGKESINELFNNRALLIEKNVFHRESNKTKIKDWKACVRTWEKSGQAKPQHKKNGFDNFKSRYEADPTLAEKVKQSIERKRLESATSVTDEEIQKIMEERRKAREGNAQSNI